MAASRQLFADFLGKGLSESDKVKNDVLRSSFVDDFFSDKSLLETTSTTTTRTSSERVKIATLDIGRYRPEDIVWKVEDDHVIIRGKHCSRTAKGAQGGKFLRCFPIPEEVKPQTVSARFSIGDGQLVVEGTKSVKTKLKRSSSQTAYFGDSHFSLSMDLGDDMPKYFYTEKPENIKFDQESEKTEIQLV